jgi:hypothetical protein
MATSDQGMSNDELVPSNTISPIRTVMIRPCSKNQKR